jgi:hypothetical protein
VVTSGSTDWPTRWRAATPGIEQIMRIVLTDWVGSANPDGRGQTNWNERSACTYDAIGRASA